MNVLLGVTGSISAYKACNIISGLKNTNNTIKVIATKNALNFITEMTLSILSGNEVITTMWGETKGNVEHIDIANWCDILVVAPASVNIINKIRYGICDDCLSTTIFALPSTTKKIIAPAMNTRMYENLVSQGSINDLEKMGWKIIGPTVGNLACGGIALGALESPRKIIEITNNILNGE